MICGKIMVNIWHKRLFSCLLNFLPKTESVFCLLNPEFFNLESLEALSLLLSVVAFHRK